jgi:hypothetical protein
VPTNATPTQQASFAIADSLFFSALRGVDVRDLTMGEVKQCLVLLHAIFSSRDRSEYLRAFLNHTAEVAKRQEQAKLAAGNATTIDPAATEKARHVMLGQLAQLFNFIVARARS